MVFTSTSWYFAPSNHHSTSSIPIFLSKLKIVLFSAERIWTVMNFLHSTLISNKSDPIWCSKILLGQHIAVQVGSFNGKVALSKLKIASATGIFSINEASYDYFLFPNMKKCFGCKRFRSCDEFIDGTNLCFEGLLRYIFPKLMKNLRNIGCNELV